MPKPLKRSKSLVKLGEESSLLKGDRIYDLQRKKMEKIRKIETEMLTVTDFNPRKWELLSNRN
jgi:hypothetical protein